MMFSVSEHIYTVRATSTHGGNMRLVFIEGDQSGKQQAQMSNLNMSLFVLSFYMVDFKLSYRNSHLKRYEVKKSS